MILTPFDVGFRRFGPLPKEGGGLDANMVAEMVRQTARYEVAGASIRRHGRKTGTSVANTLNLITVLDRQAVATDPMRFIEDHFRSELANTPVPKFFTQNDVLEELVDEFTKQDKSYLACHRLTQGMALATSQTLRPYFRDRVAPAFFRRYPQGRIAVIRTDTEYDSYLAQLRMLYTAAQTPYSAIQGDLPGVHMLDEWHKTSSVTIGPMLLDVYFYLFYPFIGGFRAGPPGLDFVFLFDEPERHDPVPFPANWLAVATHAASFGKESVDGERYVAEFNDRYGQQAGHQRFLFASGYSVDDRLTLLEWFLGCVNRFLYELTDAANFTEGHGPESPIDPVFGYEHLLTVDRLIRKTLLCMSLDEVGTAKMQVFEVAEIYDQLATRFGASAGGSDVFKKLFHTMEAGSLLSPRLAKLPAPFATDFASLASDIYQRIEQFMIGTIWARSKVGTSVVSVRNKDGSGDTAVAYPDFVAELMRGFRNAHHGYFTVGDRNQRRPSRYLFMVNGDLPNQMTALPALWFLAYLADPTLVGWQHLPVGVF